MGFQCEHGNVIGQCCCCRGHESIGVNDVILAHKALAAPEPCVSCAAKDVEIGTLKEQLREKEEIIYLLKRAVWASAGMLDDKN